jgi:hypothetical protein
MDSTIWLLTVLPPEYTWVPPYLSCMKNARGILAIEQHSLSKVSLFTLTTMHERHPRKDRVEWEAHGTQHARVQSWTSLGRMASSLRE